MSAHYPYGIENVVQRLGRFSDALAPLHEGRGEGVDTRENSLHAMAAALLEESVKRPDSATFFDRLVVNGNDAGSLALAARYYGDILGANRDYVWFSYPPGAGAIANTPGFSISIGAPEGFEHPAVAAARVRIPSYAPLSEGKSKPIIARLMDHAIVDGETVPFHERLELDGVVIEREGDYGVSIDVEGRSAEYSTLDQFSSAIKRLADRGSFMQALEGYLPFLMEHFDDFVLEMERSIPDVEQPAGGLSLTEAALKEFKSVMTVFRVLDQFTRNPHMKARWEHIIARGYRHHASNILAKLQGRIDLIQIRSSRGKPIAPAEIRELIADAKEFYRHPLIHIERTFANFTDAHRWIFIDCPGCREMDLPPRIGSLLFIMLNRIIFRAGQGARGDHPVEQHWNHAKRTLEIVDRTPGGKFLAEARAILAEAGVDWPSEDPSTLLTQEVYSAIEVARRRAVDDVASSPAYISLDWDAPTRTATIADHTPDRSALWAFEENRSGRRTLENMVPMMGPGSGVKFTPGTHPVSQIAITLPHCINVKPIL